MARTNNLSNFLTDVASAIKTKKGSETSIPAANFDTEILALPSQGTYEQKVMSITTNGTQTIVPSSGFDAIDELELTVAVPEKRLQSKTYNFTQNTTTQLSPDTGYDGFDVVSLNINVEDSEYSTNLAISNDILGEPSDLPYIPLEYIESTGIQYIDTGVVPNVNTKLETNFAVTDLSRRLNYMGTALAGGDGFFEFGTNKSETGYAALFSIRDEGGLKVPEYADTNYHTYVVSNGLQKVDDFVANNTIDNFLSTMVNLYLFKRNVTWAAEDSDQFAKAKMKYCKIWQGDVLIRHFIPVKRKSNDEICMYDLVSGVFYTNAGTGTFVAGE